MTLRAPGNRRVRLGDATAARIQNVDAGEHAAPEIRMRGIDAGVEECHGHAGSIEARDLEVGDRSGQYAAVLRGLCRIRDPDGEDPRDLAVVVEK